MDALILNSDNVIEITKLTNGLTGAVITSATVQLWLLDMDDTEISGETWPLTMDYVVGTVAAYRATAKYDLPLTHGQTVKAKVVADAGVGFRREWVKPYKITIGT